MNEEIKEQALSGGVYIDIHDNGDITVNPNLKEMTVTHHYPSNPTEKEVEVETETVQEEEEKDDQLLIICDNRKDVYNELKRKLILCKGPKDLKEVLEFLIEEKCIKSQDMFNEGLVYKLLDYAPNYKGKRDYNAIRVALYD